jgi:predicted tellurium resistance membrane protein TerC
MGRELISRSLIVIGCWLLVIGCWLFVVSYWLVVIGWSLLVGRYYSAFHSSEPQIYCRVVANLPYILCLWFINLKNAVKGTGRNAQTTTNKQQTTTNNQQTINKPPCH